MIDRFGHALAAWLLPVNAWTALLLAGALLLDRAFARRASAGLRIALYAPVALRVLVPLSWSIPGAHLARITLLMPLQALSASATPAASPVFAGYGALAAVYVAVTAGLALRAVVTRWQLARALASARPVSVIDAPCPVLCHAERGPMVVGLLRPRIVLPQVLVQEASAHALECIARHEVAHVRRRDPWLAAAVEVMLLVAWPVLPLWIAAARVRHLVELACDEAALRDADAAERRRYGHLLLDIAEQRPMALAGAGALHFGSTLRARIEAIALHRPWPRVAQSALVSAAVAGFVACSSAAPSTIPEPTGTARGASTAAATDEYGYKYENDSLQHASDREPVPADRDHGRLPPEVIQNVVRSNFGSFRTCYESGLQRNAKLQGTVTVSFAIKPDGTVQDAKDDGSTLADPAVVQCIVQGFGALSYPPPQGGYVTVVYPIIFSPD